MGLIIFLIGLAVGSLFGAVLICLIQVQHVNKWEEDIHANRNHQKK